MTPLTRSDLLVAVAAHADDAELNAGGLMAKWHAGGGSVAIVMVTNNCSGILLPGDGDELKSFQLPPEETSALRHREQEEAASLLGARVHYLGYPQRHFFNGKEVVSIGYGESGFRSALLDDLPPLIIAYRKAEHVRRLADLLVQLAPRRVVTQISTDIDPEHLAVCSMTWQAFRMERERLANTHLQFWSPGTSCPGGTFDPGYDRFEDITPYYRMKRALCASHRSQMTAARWDMVEKRALHWGRILGVEYAEPYKSANRTYDGC